MNTNLKRLVLGWLLILALRQMASGAYPYPIAIAAGGIGYNKSDDPGFPAHSLAMLSDGSVWAWGNNERGQLGSGDFLTVSWPVPVVGLSNAGKLVAGAQNSFALLSDGTVRSWGFNDGDGELGNNSTSDSETPVTVTGLTGIATVGAGMYHTLAVKSNGTVWAWGWNSKGQLGVGNTNATLIPVPVSGLSNVTAVAAGRSHSVAVSNGVVWAWGFNDGDGELGNGTTAPSSVPVLVSNLGNVTAVSAGVYHSLALKSDGTVWSWGWNSEGQLGMGNLNQTLVPVQVIGLTNVIAIAAAARSSFALLADGTVWAWGFSDISGELGNGTIENSAVPTRVRSLRNIKLLTAGAFHALALRADNTVWAWGYNKDGQIGDDTTWDRVLPVAMEGLNIYDPGAANPLARSRRFERGHGPSGTYHSFLIPLDGQKGVKLSPERGNADVLFKTNQWSKVIYHLNVDLTNNPLEFQNPIAAFGSRVGGSRLYYNQNYSFGVYAGTVVADDTNALAIEIYDKTTTNCVATNFVSVPNPARTNEWETFLKNGYTLTTNFYGLTTTIFFDVPHALWGTTSNGTFRLTHQATPTNYFYSVNLRGKLADDWMVSTLETTNSGVCSRLYTMEFEAQQPWRSVFIDRPQFDGLPLPSTYYGKSIEELLEPGPAVTNAVSLTPSACTNLNQSPELWQHPILDQFVADMGNDPLALANYVLNEIELTDGLDYNDDGSISETSINLGGVNRSALGTFLEGQGSPTEQCALLVYLMRKAGFPAVYLYPPHNGLLMLDRQMSKLLRMQFHGLVDENGKERVPDLIPVNYPWVAVNITTNGTGTNWIHIFPWLKDTEIVEGVNLYDYLPTNYNNGFKWLKNYSLGDTNILWLNLENNAPSSLFPKFVEAQLLQNTNSQNISVDDVGVRVFNRRNYRSSWSAFPTPFWVTNTAITVESLGSSSITNVSPALTNIFDTVSVLIYSPDSSSASNATRIFTGDLRMSDLHNRKFLVTYDTNTAKLNLSLASYQTNITNITAFTNDPALTNKQVLSSTLASTNNALQLEVTYRRHRSLPNWTDIVTNAPEPWDVFTGLLSVHEIKLAPTIYKGDLAAICLNPGRVSQAMLNVYAREFWELENRLKKDPSYTNSLSSETYSGTPAFLMGMAYYERVGKFRDVAERMHKIHAVSWNAAGLAKLSPKRSGGAVTDWDLYQPGVDMFFQRIAIAGNGTLRPDAGGDANSADSDFLSILLAESSAQEHQIINSFYKQFESVSTVRLLQLAQAAGAPGVLFLNRNNYKTYGDAYYGSPSKQLKNHDSTLWSQVTNAFENSAGSNLTQVLITPGPVTSAGNPYKGMGALILDRSAQFAALIGQNQNGGAGAYFPTPSFRAAFATIGTLYRDTFGTYSMTWKKPSPAAPVWFPDSYATYRPFSVWGDASSGGFMLTSGHLSWGWEVDRRMGWVANSDNGAIAAAVLNTGQSGDPGPPSPGQRGFWSTVADPVNVVTGEFYVDDTDLSLAGVMPLQIRRNYSSLNQAANHFGYGWKLNYMHYLAVNVDTNTIYAADVDGAVIGYERSGTNDVWLPTQKVNPHQSNRTTAGIGSTANVYNSKLVRVLSGSTNTYYLTNADGSVRTFDWKKFEGASTNSRPYLTKWQDNRGNFYTFDYGTNGSQPDFGQLRRIKSSGGRFLGFYYDWYGRIIEAYTDDGRRLTYEYDTYGDLVKMIRPDATELRYEYQHYTATGTNNVTNTFSAHLLIKEIKPDGRVLANVYDSQRRVTNQLATVGPDLNLVTNAFFTFSNDYVATNSFTNGISGYSLIRDVFGGITRYEYTNGLITLISNPVNQLIVQDWYLPNETNKTGYYPRSLEKMTDYRGLETTYQYDFLGNVTNVSVKGDCTGSGDTNTTVVSTFTYNTNTLVLLESLDPWTNKVKYAYGASYPYLPTNVIHYAGATPIVTNACDYYNATNVETLGGVNKTNIAFGLKLRSVRAFASPDAATGEWTYDGRGFITQQIAYTGTADPNVTNTFFYNNRGELVEQTDGAGRKTKFDYDGLGRLKYKEIYEAGQTIPLAWDNTYYNGNGEVVWKDGPRYDPEDYVWFDYDGAGRKTQEIHWRSRARADGAGVESETGDNLYSTSFFQYDAFGNLTKATDPRGTATTNSYDAVGRLTRTVTQDPAGTTLTTNTFSYEIGGEVAFQTNALGGVTERQYTTTGKPKYQKNPDGSTNAWRYQIDGRPQREFLSNGSYWETTYDDLNRKVTRTFKNSGGTVLATAVKVFDRRGNTITNIDVEGYTLTSTFDGLDRAKVTTGPPTISGVSTQQVATMYYDAAGVTVMSASALGETNIIVSDALGRPVQTQVKDSANNVVRQTTITYAPNHHGQTMTVGTGANAISTTSFTDTFGQPVLTQTFPAAGITNFTLNAYDVGGNVVTSQDELKQVTTFVYDALNRVATNTLPDGAATTFEYNAGGATTKRLMPGGVTWQATYTNDNRILTEKSYGGAVIARTNFYTYNNSGAFVGRLQSVKDGRSVTTTPTYDDWLRVTSDYATYPDTTGTFRDYYFDRRGLLTNVIQIVTEAGGAPDMEVHRSFDGYGQLFDEQVLLNGSTGRHLTQIWNAAGRRSQLARGNQVAAQGAGAGSAWSFAQRADGLLTSVAAGGQTYNFSYGDQGLLTTRSNPFRTETWNTRDGVGRVKQQTTTVGAGTPLAETLNWRADSTLDDYSGTRTTFTDARDFNYNARGQLTSATLSLNSTQSVTNSYGFDTAKLGVLMSATQTGALTNRWQAGTLDGFERVTGETNAQTRVVLRASGNALGAVSVDAKLNGAATNASLTTIDGHWWSDLDLTPGSHTLTATANHPAGYAHPSATNTFTVTGTNSVSTGYDGMGNVSTRTFPGGRVETFTWDALGRCLQRVMKTGSTTNYLWTAAYDPLGRRIRTTFAGATTVTIDSWYDPQVEFLEVAVEVNGARAWKIYGPDMSGSYGGLQGWGGIEATVTESGGAVTGILNDHFGHAVATVSGGVVSWNVTRFDGYGPVQGYQAQMLSPNVPVAEALGWHGLWADLTGDYQTGVRLYGAQWRRYYSCDPLGLSASRGDLYGYCDGDGINRSDPDGRQFESFGFTDTAESRAVILRGNRDLRALGYATIATVATDGAAAPLLTRIGFGGRALLAARGTVAAAGGDVVLQGSQMLSGDRQAYSPAQTAISMGLGFGIATLAPILGNMIVRPFTAPSTAELPQVVQQIAQGELFSARATAAGFSSTEVQSLPQILKQYEFSAPWRFGAAAGSSESGQLYLQLGRLGYETTENAIAHELSHVLQNARQPGLFAAEQAGALSYQQIVAAEQQAYLIGQGGGWLMPRVNAAFNAYPVSSWVAASTAGAASSYGLYQASDSIGDTLLNYATGLLRDPIGKYQKKK